MKQLVFEYLTSSYPDIHLMKTKFGDLVRGFDSNLFWYDVHRDMIKSVIKLFSVDMATAEEFVKEWVNSLPYVENESCTSSIITDM